MDYSKIQEPCFVCECEDALGEERGTQSHPINCGWRVGREKAGYEKGLNEIYKMCTIDDETDLVALIAKIKTTALNSMMHHYDVKEELK